MIFYSIEQYRRFALERAEEAKKVPLTADELIELDPYGENPDRLPETVVALGNFDGVHAGHQALIKNALTIRRIFPSSKLLVLTFSGLKKGEGFITPPEKKAELLSELGADFVIVEDFERIKDISAEDFVCSVLKDSLCAKNVFCGYNYRFGKGAEGDAQALRRLCVKFGISCSVLNEIKLPDPKAPATSSEEDSDEVYLPPLSFGAGIPSSRMGGFPPFGAPSLNIPSGTFGNSAQFGNMASAPFGAVNLGYPSPTGQPGFPPFAGTEDSGAPMIPVSSSDIRKALANGDIERANLLLGRDFSVCSKVLSGRKDGQKQLGAPTLNQEIPKGMTDICRGVYASYVIIDKKRLPAVTDVGVHPTFGEGKRDLIETHVIGDDIGDCYGKTVEVFFLARLRDEIIFPSAKELSEQIQKDIKRSLSLQSEKQPEENGKN